MCGRFTQQRPTSDLAEIFGAEDLASDGGGHFNVAPTDEASVVVERDSRRAIVRYRWGLVPHWAEDTRSAARRINARSETLEQSPAFRDAFQRRRCLVPADSFYEWRREASVRQPYRIARTDGLPLVLAGLWAGRRDPATDQVVRTFTIITSAANQQIGELHDRMPVVLPDSAWDLWLGRSTAANGELLGLLGPSDVPLDIYPVVRLVNDVRNDGPALIEPLAS
jgi:putative SOS response-associated peptidase YedK